MKFKPDHILRRVRQCADTNPLARAVLESIRAYAGLRIAVFAAGALVCAVSALARHIGLGIDEQFLFYRLWSLTRSNLFDIGGLLIIVSLIPRARFFFYLSGALARETAAGFPGLRAECHRVIEWDLRPALAPRIHPPLLPILSVQVALAAVVCLAALWLNRTNFLGYIDGQYLLTLMKNQGDFAALGPVFSTNPLQGLGDVWYTTSTLWIPELRFGALFSDPQWQRIGTTWFASLEVFLAAALVAHWLGLSPARAVGAGWLAIILMMPLTYPTLVYNVPTDAPNIATSITVPFLVIVLWEGIGRGPIWHDGLRAAAVTALLWLHFIAISILTVISYPLIGLVCLVFLVAAFPRRAEFGRKLLWSAAIVTIMAASGFVQILLGMIGDTAFQLFPRDLPTRIDPQLIEGSILFRKEKMAWAIAALGVCGAVLHTGLDKGRVRLFALGSLLTIALILVLGVAHIFVSLPGAPPIYYEFVVWAVYAIFASSWLAVGWDILRSRIGFAEWQITVRLRQAAWIILPVAAVLIIHGVNRAYGLRNPLPNVYPPRPSELTEFLRSELALRAGSVFRGRVATLTGQTLPPAATWGQMYALDIDLIRAVGNDHRTIGLWSFSIPTLVEFSQTLTPLIYAVAKRYLAYPDDLQYRNILNMRRPDVHVLRLLGVRYIISDSPKPAAGTHRLLGMPAGRLTLFVDEIEAPNLGASPVEIRPLTMHRAALEWLGHPTSDFQTTALLEGPVPAPLSQATDIRINVERGGIRVRAQSQGRSLVVLPFLYSHCLTAVPLQGSAPELRRANLLLTGILFEGVLDTLVEYRQGPIQGVSCRLHDLADDRAFVGTL